MASEDFVKFPRSKHLHTTLPARDDLVMTKAEQAAFLNRQVFVQEKVDGASLGIFYDSDSYSFKFQNRSHLITSATSFQFSKLDSWVNSHYDDLYELLSDGRFILIGEWLFSTHSIHYTKLPDTFIAFDLFDRENSVYLSLPLLELKLKNSSIKMVNLLSSAVHTKIEDIIALASKQSAYYDGPVEGIFVRICDDEKTLQRGKIISLDFTDTKKKNSSESWAKLEKVQNIVI